MEPGPEYHSILCLTDVWCPVVLYICAHCSYSAVLCQCPRLLMPSCPPPPPPTHQKVEKQTFLFPQPRVESGPDLRTNPSIANVIKSIVTHTNTFSLLQPAAMDTCRKACIKWSHIYYLPTSQYLLNVGVLASSRRVYITSFLVTSI